MSKGKPHTNRAFRDVRTVVERVCDSEATPLRWTCHHHMDGSDILAFVLTKDGLATIAHTKKLDGVNAQANAELIVQAINNHEQYRPIIAELVDTLEFCLQSGAPSWEVEQEADIVCRKAKQIAAL